MRDEKNCPDGPGVEVVVQDKEIRSSVFENGALHLGVSRVDNFGTEGFRLAFELERGITRGADVINRGGALWRRTEARGFAGRAEKVQGAPGFGADTCALGGAVVAVEACGWEMQIHAAIRSWTSKG